MDRGAGNRPCVRGYGCVRGTSDPGARPSGPDPDPGAAGHGGSVRPVTDCDPLTRGSAGPAAGHAAARCRHQPRLHHRSVPVRPDGKISTPLVEDLVAVGKTSSQLAREIEKALAEYIRSPQVNIIVTNPISTFSQVKVIGEVANPQSMPFREGLTVLDVVLAVGGLTQFAAGNRAKIVRKSADGKDVEVKVKLDALVRKGKISENVPLRPGDVLIVPASLF